MRLLILGWALAGILVIFGLIFIYLTLRNWQGNVASAANASIAPYTINVGADGSASASPDVAYVSLGVDMPARTAADATGANSTAMAAVIQAVKALGVADKDIRTTGFSLTPVYANPRPGEMSPPTITGYRASNTVRVTIGNIQDVGKVLDAGLQANANSGVNVSFDLKHGRSHQSRALRAQPSRHAAEPSLASDGGQGRHLHPEVTSWQTWKA